MGNGSARADKVCQPVKFPPYGLFQKTSTRGRLKKPTKRGLDAKIASILSVNEAFGQLNFN